MHPLAPLTVDALYINAALPRISGYLVYNMMLQKYSKMQYIFGL